METLRRNYQNIFGKDNEKRKTGVMLLIDDLLTKSHKECQEVIEFLYDRLKNSQNLDEKRGSIFALGHIYLNINTGNIRDLTSIIVDSVVEDDMQIRHLSIEALRNVLVNNGVERFMPSPKDFSIVFKCIQNISRMNADKDASIRNLSLKFDQEFRAGILKLLSEYEEEESIAFVAKLCELLEIKNVQFRYTIFVWIFSISNQVPNAFYNNLPAILETLLVNLRYNVFEQSSKTILNGTLLYFFGAEKVMNRVKRRLKIGRVEAWSLGFTFRHLGNPPEYFRAHLWKKNERSRSILEVIMETIFRYAVFSKDSTGEYCVEVLIQIVFSNLSPSWDFSEYLVANLSFFISRFPLLFLGNQRPKLTKELISIEENILQILTSKEIPPVSGVAIMSLLAKSLNSNINVRLSVLRWTKCLGKKGQKNLEKILGIFLLDSDPEVTALLDENLSQMFYRGFSSEELGLFFISSRRDSFLDRLLQQIERSDETISATSYRTTFKNILLTLFQLITTKKETLDDDFYVRVIQRFTDVLFLGKNRRFTSTILGYIRSIYFDNLDGLRGVFLTTWGHSPLALFILLVYLQEYGRAFECLKGVKIGAPGFDSVVQIFESCHFLATRVRSNKPDKYPMLQRSIHALMTLITDPDDFESLFSRFRLSLYSLDGGTRQK